MPQTVKLYFHVKDHFGKKNSNISQIYVEKCVADYILKYWKMAGFQTLALFRVDKYKNINKAKARNSKTEENKRVEYLDRIKKLFDISTPDLETILQKNRLLQKDDECKRYRVEENYTRKVEDINFPKDQRNERKMVLDVRDQSYGERLEVNKERMIVSKHSGQSSSQTDHPLITEEEESDEMDISDKKDVDYSIGGKYKKKVC